MVGKFSLILTILFFWSAHEATRGRSINRVGELYRFESDDIWVVSYDHDNNSQTPEQEITCTGSHPFWRETENAFVRADELEAGASFVRLIGGKKVPVLGVEKLRGPPGISTKVYNFAVANHHTYFAGPGGVWVHSVCPGAVEPAAVEFSVQLQRGTGNLDEALRETIKLYDEAASAAGAKKLLQLNQRERVEVAASMVERAAKDLRIDDAEELLSTIRQGLKLGEEGAGHPLSMVIDEAAGVAAMSVKPSTNKLIPAIGDEVAKFRVRLVSLGFDESSTIWKVAGHSEASSLMRLIKQIEDNGGQIPKRLVMVTQGHPVCGGCVANAHRTTPGGLAQIADMLGIEELVLRSQTWADGTLRASGVTEVVLKGGLLQ